MIITNIKIREFENRLICEALILSNKWEVIDNIVYFCEDAEWYGDHYNISDNIKKKCRRAWYNAANVLGINRKALNIII